MLLKIGSEYDGRSKSPDLAVMSRSIPMSKVLFSWKPVVMGLPVQTPSSSSIVYRELLGYT